jgi:hypothetical protein
MTLTVSSRLLAPDAQPFSLNQVGQRTYELTWEVDQTDGGALAAGPSVFLAGSAVLTGNPVALGGDQFSYGGFTDLDSFAQELTGRRPDPLNAPKRWHFTWKYMPLSGTSRGKLTTSDPLMFPTEYWVEWTEEQVVLEEAKNVDALPSIGRTALTTGPVVNACGVEFTEPLMKTIYYPVLHCQKSYATLDEIVALNTTYQGTTNNGNFFGAPQRTAKYLGTESGRIQRISGTEFYTGITRIWFKDATWDRQVLNNGWSHLETDSGGNIITQAGKPKLFINRISQQTKSEAEADPEAEPDARASEPLNLTRDGLLRDPDALGVYVSYRDLDEVDYSGIGIGS